MIYVRVEMWPKGSHDHRYPLGEALIENRGGSKSKANYRVLLSKKGGFASSKNSMSQMRVNHVWKEVLVPGFPRAYLGSWYLLASALQSVCGKALARVGCKAGAKTAGVSCGKVDHHGELELILEVDGEKGSCFISREMWEALGDVAGWTARRRSGRPARSG